MSVLKLDFVVKQMRGLGYTINMQGIHSVLVTGYGKMRVDDFRGWAEKTKEMRLASLNDAGYDIPAYPTKEDFE